MDIKEFRSKQLMHFLFGNLGLLVFCGSFYWLYFKLDMTVPEFTNPIDRIIFALQWLSLPFVTFAMGITAVANTRFLTKAIDPTLGLEPDWMKVNIRYVTNTLEQLFVLVFSLVTLTTVITLEQMKVIPILCLIFVVGRISFWIGYLIDPAYRAMGMVMTGFSAFLPLFYIIYKLFLSAA